MPLKRSLDATEKQDLDASDPVDVTESLQALNHRLGRIEGVLHACHAALSTAREVQGHLNEVLRPYEVFVVIEMIKEFLAHPVEMIKFATYLSFPIYILYTSSRRSLVENIEEKAKRVDKMMEKNREACKVRYEAHKRATYEAMCMAKAGVLPEALEGGAEKGVYDVGARGRPVSFVP